MAIEYLQIMCSIVAGLLTAWGAVTMFSRHGIVFRKKLELPTPSKNEFGLWLEPPKVEYKKVPTRKLTDEELIGYFRKDFLEYKNFLGEMSRRFHHPEYAYMVANNIFYSDGPGIPDEMTEPEPPFSEKRLVEKIRKLQKDGLL